ncbi:MAG: hypothetical protein WCN92_02845 [Eubacteriales bacterium]
MARERKTKVCKCCGKRKRLEEFRLHKASSRKVGTRLNTCTACEKEQNRKYAKARYHAKKAAKEAYETTLKSNLQENLEKTAVVKALINNA